MPDANRVLTFVVRVVQSGTGGLRAVVERVKTGRKEQASTMEDIGRVIAAMTLGGEAAMTLKGKHALVTGGSRGIGRGIALKLAETGARVAIHYYVNEGAANETLERVRQHGSHGHLATLGCDGLGQGGPRVARALLRGDAGPAGHHGQQCEPRADRRQRAERLAAAGRGHRARLAPERLDAHGAHGHARRHRQRGGAAVLARRRLDYGPAHPRRRRRFAGGHAHAARGPAWMTGSTESVGCTKRK